MLAYLKKLMRSKNSSHKTIAALHWQEHAFQLLLVKQDNSTPKGFRCIESAKVIYEENEWPVALKEIVKKYLSADEFVVCLSPEHYEVTQLDKPDVADDELASALKWQLQELVNTAPEDMHFDWLELPNNTSNTRLLTIVSSKKKLKKLVRILSDFRITISSIAPEEWGFQALINDQTQPCMLLSYRSSQELTMTIYHHGALRFFRRVRGFNRLADFSQEEVRMRTLEALELEVHRSLDYFQGQLKQPTVRHITLALETPWQDDIADYLRRNDFIIDTVQLDYWFPNHSIKECMELVEPLTAAMVCCQQQRG